MTITMPSTSSPSGAALPPAGCWPPCCGAVLTAGCSGADARLASTSCVDPRLDGADDGGYSGSVVNLPVPHGVTSVQISATGGSGGDGLNDEGDCGWRPKIQTREGRAQWSPGPSRSPPGRRSTLPVAAGAGNTKSCAGSRLTPPAARGNPDGFSSGGTGLTGYSTDSGVSGGGGGATAVFLNGGYVLLGWWWWRRGRCRGRSLRERRARWRGGAGGRGRCHRWGQGLRRGRGGCGGSAEGRSGRGGAATASWEGGDGGGGGGGVSAGGGGDGGGFGGGGGGWGGA